MQLQYTRLVKFIFIFFAVASVYLFVAPTQAYAGGVQMVVKVHKHLSDGSIIENPPVDIQINWSPASDPELCNDSGQITYMGADAVPGVSNSYNGPTHKLYSGTRETAVWRLNEDYNPPAWEWTGTGGGIGNCGCTNRRATITLDYNGTPVTLTQTFKAPGFTDGGPFNNWTDVVAEFDFYPPTTACYTPTPTPIGVPPRVRYLEVNKSPIDPQYTRGVYQLSGSQTGQGGANQLNTLRLRVYVEKGSRDIKNIIGAFYQNGSDFSGPSQLGNADETGLLDDDPRKGFMVLYNVDGTACDGILYCVWDGGWKPIGTSGREIAGSGGALYTIRTPQLGEADYGLRSTPGNVQWVQWDITLDKNFGGKQMRTTGFAYDSDNALALDSGSNFNPISTANVTAQSQEYINGVPVCQP